MQTALVVDDDPGVIGVMSELMQRAGFRVLVASDGERALAVLRDFQVDVMLLDLRMPVVDGESVLLLAKYFLRPGSRPRLVIVTGDPNGPHRLGTIVPDVVLRKPFDIADLYEAVGVPEPPTEAWQ